MILKLISKASNTADFLLGLQLSIVTCYTKTYVKSFLFEGGERPSVAESHLYRINKRKGAVYGIHSAQYVVG